MTETSPAALPATPSSSQSSGQLLRVLGAGFGIAVVIGGTIGVGILRNPSTVALHAGSPTGVMLLWLAGGLYALMGAAAYADLGTSFARSGGVYVYVRRALGEGPGFVVGWADMFSTCSAVAYLSLGFAEFSSLLWQGLAPWPGAVAVTLVVFFALTQLGGVRLSSWLQEAGSALKALLFLALIGGLLFLATPAAAPAATGQIVKVPGIVGVVLAMQLILQTYDGWGNGLYFTGEDRAPDRNLPRALLGGVLLVLTIYLLMNVALLQVLPFEVLASSPLPAAEAARAWLGDGSGRMITLVAAVSILPTIGASMLVGTRIVHAMAEDRCLPARLGSVDARGTPVPALLAISGAALLLIFASGGVLQLMLGIGALFAIVGYIGGFVSLLVLRRREPQLPRPFRSWGFPYTTWIVLAGSVALFVGVLVSAPRDSLIAIVVLGVSYPIYRLTRRFRGAASG